MHPTDQLPAIVAKLPAIALKCECYRLVDFAMLTSLNPMMPLYTLGPGRNGQRYTPKNGPNALYVAEDLVTAQAEHFGVSRVVLTGDPNYKVKANPTVQLITQMQLERVLDLTDPAVQKAFGTTAAELTGPWRKQMIKKIFCPTHVLATVVYDSGLFQAMRWTLLLGPEFRLTIR